VSGRSLSGEVSHEPASRTVADDCRSCHPNAVLKSGLGAKPDSDEDAHTGLPGYYLVRSGSSFSHPMPA